jgi:hypothetical protein
MKKSMFFKNYFLYYFREVPITPDINYNLVYWGQMLSDRHLLIKTLNNLTLLTIDHELWKANIVFEIEIGFRGIYIIIDQLNEQNFLIYGESEFVTGKLVDDTIVLSTRREFNFYGLYFLKLVGNQLIGISNTENVDDNGFNLWQLRKINLDTLTEETYSVPCALGDNSSVMLLDNVRDDRKKSN